MMRILIAHAKGEDANIVEGLVRDAQEAVPGAEVIKASDEWKRTFSSAGGWGPWTRQVGAGRDLNGSPTYDVYICPREYVGKATAQIVEAALSAGRRVIFGSGGDFSRVTSIIEEDSQSWVAGWRLVASPSHSTGETQ